MTWQAWVIGGLAVAVLLLAGYVVSLRRSLRSAGAEAPASAPSDLPAAEPPVAALSVSGLSVPGLPAHREPAEAEWLITRVGEPGPEHEAEDRRPTVRDSVVLSATLGEPLLRAVALAHGLRRALSPASRNRIGFEVRQEVRRSRKVRRQEMRVAWREMKAQERAQEQGQQQSQEEVPQPAPERV